MIEVFDLSKNFGQFNALKNINLKVENGEILGLLGENGAGKSTFLRILSTMLKPSSGSAEVCGFDVLSKPEKVRQSVGILFGSETVLYERMTPKENIEFFGRREASIDGLCGVLEYDGERIRLSAGKEEIVCCGQGLSIDVFDLGQAVIHGEIMSMEFCK